MSDGELSGVAVLLLALLAERPMHPYEAYLTLEQRHATRLVRVNAGAVYHAFERLERVGLADRVGTDRQGRRPERTTYSITAAGSKALAGRIESLLIEDPPSYPLFTVALSEAECLAVPVALAALRERRSRLDIALDLYRRSYDALVAEGLPRRHILELEYEIATKAAQTAWLGTLIDDLAAGAIEWNPAPVDLDESVTAVGSTAP